MSISHIIIVALVMIIVIPPDKLPEVMRNIARVFNELRRSTSGVWDDIKREAAVRPEDLFKHNQKNAHQPMQETQHVTDTVAVSQEQNHQPHTKADSSDGSKS